MILKQTLENIMNLTYKCSRTAVHARVYLSAAQLNLTHNTPILVALNTEANDLGGNFNTTTNTFTTPVAGEYLIIGSCVFTNPAANTRYISYIYVNGAASRFQAIHAASTTAINPIVMMNTYLPAAAKITLYAESEKGDNSCDLTAGITNTSLDIMLLAAS